MDFEDEDRLRELKKYLNATLTEFESLVASAGDFDDTRLGNGWDATRIEESFAILTAKPKDELFKSLGCSGMDRLARLFGRLAGKAPSGVVISSCRCTYVPFWSAKGLHECYYFRSASYKVPTSGDVVAVEVDGSLKNLVLQESRPSNVLEILKLRIDRLAGIISEKPRHFVLDGVTELARKYKEAVLCLDRFGRADSDLESAIERGAVLHRFKDGSELRKHTGDAEVAKTDVSKEVVIRELHKRVVLAPSSFSRILTNRFDVTELILLYLPLFRIEYSCDCARHNVVMDASSGRLIGNRYF